MRAGLFERVGSAHPDHRVFVEEQLNGVAAFAMTLAEGVGYLIRPAYRSPIGTGEYRPQLPFSNASARLELQGVRLATTMVMSSAGGAPLVNSATC